MDEIARLEAEKAEQESEEEEFNLDAEGTITNFKDMGLYDDKKEKSPIEQLEKEQGEDFWLLKDNLKINRIKNKIDGDAKR